MQEQLIETKITFCEVMVIVGPQEELPSFLAELKRLPGLKLRSAPTLGALTSDDYLKTDILVVHYDLVRALDENQALIFRRRHRDGFRLIVALKSAQIYDAADMLCQADGWLFIDQQRRHLESVLTLSQGGIVVIPGQLLGAFDLRTVRLRVVDDFSKRERQVLAALGEGLSNRSITQRFGTSDAQTKAIVRRILRSMRFRNRTEAGVYAARFEARRDRDT